jgi:PPOX class probable F420-dependent enzyme
MDGGEMRRRFGAARVARLATVRDDGRPHVVPVCFALDGDSIVSAVDAKPKRRAALQRLDNVRAHPDVSLLVDHYDDDWSRLWWVRVDGPARVVEGGAEHAAAIARLASKYAQYRDAPPTGAVVAVEARQWRAWAAT